MRRGYRWAIWWIVQNDDVTDVAHAGTPTMALVADMFGKDDEKIKKDILKEMEKQERKI